MLALAAMLACAPTVFGQTIPPIEQQMPPAEFKASGLDKLNAEELAHLNAWLGRTVDDETTKAVKASKKKSDLDSRGFFNFGSREPVTGRITGTFKGFSQGSVYTLADGQMWKQVDDASLAGVRLINPQVKITPALTGNVWFLQIIGYNTRAKVERVK